MSFFMKRNRDGSRSNGGSSRATGRPPSSSTGRLSSRLGNRGGKQGQMLLQRPSQQRQEQGKKQTLNQKSDKQTSDQAMQELFSDLHELESQQRQSQRKLDSIRQRKEQKEAGRLELEDQLEQFKYKNGQQRVHLGKAREKLGAADRVLKKHRMHGDRARGKTNCFDKALKRAIAAAQINREHRRKIETQLVIVLKKAGIVKQLQKEASYTPPKLGRAKEQIQLKLHILQRHVKEQTDRAKEHSVEVSRARDDAGTLQSEMCKAQQSEASMLAQAQTHSNEVQTAIFQQSQGLGALNQKMKECSDFKAAKQAVAKEKQSTIDIINQGTSKLLGQFSHLRDSKVGTDHSEGDDPLDLSWVESLLNDEGEALMQSQIKQQLLVESGKSLEKVTSDLEQQEQSNNTKTNGVYKESQAVRVQEEERTKSFQKLIDLLEAARNEVDVTQKNYQELEESRENNRSEAAEQAATLKESIQNEKKRNHSLPPHFEEVASSITSTEESRAHAETESNAKKRELNVVVEDSQTRFDEAKNSLEKVQTGKISPWETDMERGFELTKLAQVCSAISSLQDKHHKLAGISLSYNPEMTVQQQGKRCMQSLVSTCTKVVHAAQQRFEDREIDGIGRKMAVFAERRLTEEAEVKRLREEAEAKELMGLEEQRLRGDAEARLKAEEARQVKAEEEARRSMRAEEQSQLKTDTKAKRLKELKRAPLKAEEALRLTDDKDDAARHRAEEDEEKKYKEDEQQKQELERQPKQEKERKRREGAQRIQEEQRLRAEQELKNHEREQQRIIEKKREEQRLKGRQHEMVRKHEEKQRRLKNQHAKKLLEEQEEEKRREQQCKEKEDIALRGKMEAQRRKSSEKRQRKAVSSAADIGRLRPDRKDRKQVKVNLDYPDSEEAPNSSQDRERTERTTSFSSFKHKRSSVVPKKKIPATEKHDKDYSEIKIVESDINHTTSDTERTLSTMEFTTPKRTAMKDGRSLQSQNSMKRVTWGDQSDNDDDISEPEIESKLSRKRLRLNTLSEKTQQLPEEFSSFRDSRGEGHTDSRSKCRRSSSTLDSSGGVLAHTAQSQPKEKKKKAIRMSSSSKKRSSLEAMPEPEKTKTKGRRRMSIGELSRYKPSSSRAFSSKSCKSLQRSWSSSSPWASTSSARKSSSSSSRAPSDVRRPPKRRKVPSSSTKTKKKRSSLDLKDYNFEF